MFFFFHWILIIDIIKPNYFIFSFFFFGIMSKKIAANVNCGISLHDPAFMSREADNTKYSCILIRVCDVWRNIRRDHVQEENAGVSRRALTLRPKTRRSWRESARHSKHRKDANLALKTATQDWVTLWDLQHYAYLQDKPSVIGQLMPTDVWLWANEVGLCG